jgi:DNA-binding LytR/AlgR family response regulator
MYNTNYKLSDHLDSKLQSRKSLYVSVLNTSGTLAAGTEFIRFEERRERYIWAHPDEICFVKSSDHYVQSLIKCGNQKKWMSRHSTLKELLDILPANNFIRLNKFYLVNLSHLSHINESEKMLYFKDESSIDIPHRISPFLRHLLKNSNA